VLVLGAGLAGISAALALDGGYRLLEREDRPGGLCRTDVRDGFSFDATGHWLHLRDPSIRARVSRIMVFSISLICPPAASVDGEGWSGRAAILGSIRCIGSMVVAGARIMARWTTLPSSRMLPGQS
jgi:phytoene dehydrogenase-like protein